MKNIPSSVYRIQVSKECPLQKVNELIPYFHALGIECLYCSPLYEAQNSNSYAIINPNQIDPAVGGRKEYDKMCSLLESYGMKQILDVIPNHMGIKGNS